MDDEYGAAKKEYTTWYGFALYFKFMKLHNKVYQLIKMFVYVHNNKDLIVHDKYTFKLDIGLLYLS